MGECHFSNAWAEPRVFDPAAALLRLWKEGHVEPLDPPPSPFRVVAQRIMALILQEARRAQLAHP